MNRAAVGWPRRTPSAPVCNISTPTLAFDQHFTTTATGKLHLAEIVFGYHRSLDYTGAVLELQCYSSVS
ncbi:hypothetical protein KUCAC02_014596, partial [Chaenocephalus aceratus]